ncbi:hypothetical protein UY3_04053 [Chelonia mydas]|uniref:Uncharacterized protein n=1 Tax=Chelonia mydas TaxID=8469 RepID=M7BNC9_CHEMY|nr:hypothetical protein UY3_04053 [Chelonia mydas]
MPILVALQVYHWLQTSSDEVEQEDKDPDSETGESQDLGDIGGVTLEGESRQSDSSVSQNKVGIGTPDIVGTTSAKNASATGKVSPSTNIGTGVPECLNVGHSNNLHGTISGVDCMGAEEGPV